MAINVTSNFSQQSAIPLDDRTIVADTTAMNAIASGRRFEGLTCYNIAEEKEYRCDNSLAWVEVKAGGGGGSSLNWHDGDSNTPIEETEHNILLRKFLDGGSQILPATFVVPSSYSAGTQIFLRALIFGENSTSDLLLSATTTLIRKETDALNSTTNQHSSTNTTKTITTANVPYTIDIDLTDASGEINSVAVNAGDILKIELSRGTDSDSDDLRFIQFATDIIL